MCAFIINITLLFLTSTLPDMRAINRIAIGVWMVRIKAEIYDGVLYE